jgi:hypothetical protein
MDKIREEGRGDGNDGEQWMLFLGWRAATTAISVESSATKSEGMRDNGG